MKKTLYVSVIICYVTMAPLVYVAGHKVYYMNKSRIPAENVTSVQLASTECQCWIRCRVNPTCRGVSFGTSYSPDLHDPSWPSEAQVCHQTNQLISELDLEYDNITLLTRLKQSACEDGYKFLRYAECIWVSQSDDKHGLDGAKSACSNKGGRLAYLPTKENYTDVKHYLQSLERTKKRNFIVHIFDDVWHDTREGLSSSEYLEWAPGEGNGFLESCASISEEKGMKLYDYICLFHSDQYICQKAPQPPQ